MKERKIFEFQLDMLINSASVVSARAEILANEYRKRGLVGGDNLQFGLALGEIKARIDNILVILKSVKED